LLTEFGFKDGKATCWKPDSFVAKTAQETDGRRHASVYLVDRTSDNAQHAIDGLFINFENPNAQSKSEIPEIIIANQAFYFGLAFNASSSCRKKDA
jgi:hypothetical protein